MGLSRRRADFQGAATMRAHTVHTRLLTLCENANFKALLRIRPRDGKSGDRPSRAAGLARIADETASARALLTRSFSLLRTVGRERGRALARAMPDQPTTPSTIHFRRADLDLAPARPAGVKVKADPRAPAPLTRPLPELSQTPEFFRAQEIPARNSPAPRPKNNSPISHVEK